MTDDFVASIGEVVAIDNSQRMFAHNATVFPGMAGGMIIALDDKEMSFVGIQ